MAARITAPPPPPFAGVVLGRARLDVAPGAITTGAGTVLGGLAIPLPASQIPGAITVRAVIPWVQSGGVSPLWVVVNILEDGVTIQEKIIGLTVINSYTSLECEASAYVPAAGGHTYGVSMACGASTMTVVASLGPPIITPTLVVEAA